MQNSIAIVYESHYRKNASVIPGVYAVKHHYVDITTAEAANYSLIGYLLKFL